LTFAAKNRAFSAVFDRPTPQIAGGAGENIEESRKYAMKVNNRL
jgi:hypothetical protein